jgi:hypothetical protein
LQPEHQLVRSGTVEACSKRMASAGGFAGLGVQSVVKKREAMQKVALV